MYNYVYTYINIMYPSDIWNYILYSDMIYCNTYILYDYIYTL